MTKCSRCGRKTDKPTYIDGNAYGPVCKEKVEKRGPTSEFLSQLRSLPILSRDTFEGGQLQATCPSCGGFSFNERGYQCSESGGKPDTSHYQHCYECKSCEMVFFWEHKYSPVLQRTVLWYSMEEGDNGALLVIKGVPACYEDYIYLCRCGGKIRRKIHIGSATPRYSFICSDCDFEFHSRDPKFI